MRRSAAVGIALDGRSRSEMGMIRGNDDQSRWRYGYAEYDHHNKSGNARLRRFARHGSRRHRIGVRLDVVDQFGRRARRSNRATQPSPDMAASTHVKLSLRAVAYAKLAAALNSTRRSTASHIFASLLEPRPLGFATETFTRTALEETDEAEDAAEADAAPPLRSTNAKSADVSRSSHVTAQAQQIAVARSRTASPDGASASRNVVSAPVERPSFFEKLFGKPATTVLAYAAPDDEGLGVGQGASGRYDHYTAVYDISAHVVYLPDGTRLEAHSGLGAWLDDPRHTDERMRGATPATIYDLQPRESLFHGVQALRLIPVENDKVFGRTGLLPQLHARLQRPVERLRVVPQLRCVPARLHGRRDQAPRRGSAVGLRRNESSRTRPNDYDEASLVMIVRKEGSEAEISIPFQGPLAFHRDAVFLKIIAT